MAALASRYGPVDISYVNGQPATEVVASIFDSSMSLATLYTDKTKNATITNPTNTDIYGNLWFYVDPGEYIIDVAGYFLPVMVPLHPEEPLASAENNTQIKNVLTASITLSGHKIVTPTPGGTLEYASNDNLNYLNAPLWMTTQAALSGQLCEVLCYGELQEPSWNWLRQPIYLGLNGLITQSISGLFIAQIGFATSSDTVFFERMPSIKLG